MEAWGRKQVTFFDLPGQDLAVWEQETKQCRRCSLRAGCRQVVISDGVPSRLMLVGEAPGKEEDRLGKPFVGAAGQLLDRILAAVDLSRREVYITNVVKCRPPGNRLPTTEEVRLCMPFLKRQLELIQPAIIVCLGALASQTMIDQSVRITRDRGTWVEKSGARIMPTFHPAALLRDPGKKKPVWEDFKAVREEYDALVSR
ncbi:MAG: uracil-DNA glycosylase [Firmicutes bacterium]|nr:uracil-DNA glycosylase [Bacillota bacterium]